MHKSLNPSSEHNFHYSCIVFLLIYILGFFLSRMTSRSCKQWYLGTVYVFRAIYTKISYGTRKVLFVFPSIRVIQVILSSHLAKSFHGGKLKKGSHPMLRPLQTPWLNTIGLSIPHWDNSCLLLQGTAVSAVKVVVQILVRAQNGGLSQHIKIRFSFLLSSKVRWQKIKHLKLENPK